MARAFGGSARLSGSGVPGNTGNNSWSLSFWFITNALTRTTLIYQGSAGGLHTLEYDGNPTSKLTAIPFPTGSAHSSASSITTGVLYHVAYTYNGTAGVSYINGASEGSGIGAGIGLTSTNFGIGGHPVTGLQLLTGQMSDVAKWNVVLTLDEIVALSKRISPLKIRPGSRVFYAPFIRDLKDLHGMTITDTGGTTVTEHPRMYY